MFICMNPQLFLIDGFCSKNLVLGRWQPPRTTCCSVPLASCWKAGLWCQSCTILTPETGFSSSSSSQLVLWHSSCLLTGLLHLKFSCSVIYLLHGNKLLFSSFPLLFPSPHQRAAGLDSAEVTCAWETVSAPKHPQGILAQDLAQWYFTKRCTEGKLKPRKKWRELIAGICLSFLSPCKKKGQNSQAGSAWLTVNVNRMKFGHPEHLSQHMKNRDFPGKRK